MSSTEPKPLRADARRNRERIVHAARELFAECGQETQMDDVARRAGVGVGTVYRHFPTKAELIGELLAGKFRHHAEIARKWSAVDDGWEAFEGFLRETFSSIARDATLQRRASWIDDSEILAVVEVERRVVTEVLDEIIRRAQAQGSVRADFSVQDIPALMCAMGAVMAAESRMPMRADRFVELVIDGLRAP
ncbi:MAG TPA: helix-turn-helix domain-containing protein [Baekduia sp.]|nr:helix-turn-helix domain-containing protein [Baekduia sp.]